MITAIVLAVLCLAAAIGIVNWREVRVRWRSHKIWIGVRREIRKPENRPYEAK